ncbi:DNA polymerase IV [hydrothermal vent metagenome]|uniref:DNA polymerase IV n=1 Tax=hydrothermal vent metagenome TaxID=652676 RepID=A0A3B1DUN2_9ZZZZ
MSDEVKSVRHEHTFDKDTTDVEEIYKTSFFLSEKVSRRLRKLGLKGKTLTVKIRFDNFKTVIRAGAPCRENYFF